jgi:TatD DNase family protein
MTLIDSHCHLYLPEFQADLDEVVGRAERLGVEKFFLPNIDSTTLQSMLSLSEKYPGKCFPMMGLHPTSVKENYKEELALVESELQKGSYVAVGEIGIDLYWDKTFLKEQIEAFETQIGWAKLHGLPIIIHCRESFDEVFSVVDRMNDDRLSGIFHCFTGTKEQAKKIVDYGGFKMGIGGVVTFKNGGIDKFLEEIPLENFVLETDAPYLSPVPYRGKRNESAYLVEIVKKLAEIYKLPESDVAEKTSENCLAIFKMK